ncbi:MAG: hypothetical protein AAFQ28_14735 [Pseudomonadota bacterium]
MFAEMSSSPLYLEADLIHMMASEVGIWELCTPGYIAGFCRRKLDYLEDEWLSPKVWRLFGIDVATKERRLAVWQDIIFQEYLEVALQGLQQHCDNSDYAYEPIVHYRHCGGSTFANQRVATRDARKPKIARSKT